MSLQTISDRKLRQAANATGLPLIRAMRHSNHLWFGWVAKDGGHWHVEINPSTWEWEYDEGCQFSSCRESVYGPRVDPDPEIVSAQAVLDQARAAERAQKDKEAGEFVEMWKTETERWLAQR
jgi:hypothetical protein